MTMKNCQGVNGYTMSHECEKKQVINMGPWVSFTIGACHESL